MELNENFTISIESLLGFPIEEVATNTSYASKYNLYEIAKNIVIKKYEEKKQTILECFSIE